MGTVRGWAAALAAAAACTAGCGTAPPTASDGAPVFPERGSAWLKEGTFVNVDNLRQMARGLTKAQVYALLQAPHFGEGVLGANVWNYVFDFRTGGAVVTCQYQVRYDRRGQVDALHWKTADCARFVRPAGEAGEAPAASGSGDRPASGPDVAG